MIEAEVTVRGDGVSVACYTGTRDELIAAGLATPRMIPQRRGWHRSRKGADVQWSAGRLSDGRWRLWLFGTLSPADVKETLAGAEEEWGASLRQQVREMLDELPDEDDDGIEM